MPVEAASHLFQLDPANPTALDAVGTADDHCRMIKLALRTDFPNLLGPVTSSEVHLNNPLIRTTPLANTVAYYNSNTTATTASVSALGLTLLNSANAATVISTLNLDARYMQGVGGTITGNAVVTGSMTTGSVVTPVLTVSAISPQLTLKNSTARSAFILNSGNLFYVLRGGVNADTWDSGPNGRHPMTLNLDNGYVVFSGDVQGFSDERLKTDIELIPDALAKVMALRGVTYKRGGSTRMGVVAQDVQKVLPEAVSTDADGYLSVSYGNLVGLAFEAIKELAADVAALKASR